MKNKRSFAWILSIVLMMTFVLSACGGNNNNGGNASPSGSASPSETTSATPSESASAPADKEPVTLKFISWKDTYNPLYELFHQKYPWITIEQIPVNSQPIMEIIATLEAAGTPADVTEIDQDLIAFQQNGLVEELTPYIDKDPIMQSVTLPEGFFDTMSINGKKYAVPMVDVPMWILVNKDLLAKNGLDLPPNDWTYDDFREVAKKLTNPDAGEYGLTTQPEWQMRLLSTKAVADGHADNLNYMNADLTQSRMGEPDVINDIKWLSEFVTKDGSMLNNTKAAEQGNLVNEFINGKTGFAIGGDWVLPKLKESAPFEWDVLPFPKGKVSQAGYTIYGPLALLAGSKHKEEAFLWLSFQFTQEAQKWKIDQGANASIIDPAIDAYYAETEMWKGKNFEAVQIAKKEAKIQPGVTIPGWGEYQWNNLGNQMITGDEPDFSLIAPATETWNKRTLELRAALK
ncbi:ABC transporter substrate-binding protein [Cohnella sp. GCM10027633]|uniref:ABC transporter substrate-binding protein n=1 Tax=unclassified Cohnella TaxID=2636738 RepID=UPI003644C73F